LEVRLASTRTCKVVSSRRFSIREIPFAVLVRTPVTRSLSLDSSLPSSFAMFSELISQGLKRAQMPHASRTAPAISKNRIFFLEGFANFLCVTFPWVLMWVGFAVKLLKRWNVLDFIARPVWGGFSGGLGGFASEGFFWLW